MVEFLGKAGCFDLANFTVCLEIFSSPVTQWVFFVNESVRNDAKNQEARNNTVGSRYELDFFNDFAIKYEKKMNILTDGIDK